MDAATHPERDYFPWLVGTLMAATTAIALGIAAFDPSPRESAATVAAVSSPEAPTPLAAPVVKLAATEIRPPAPALSDDAPLQPPVPAPGTRVWECSFNGLRIFSDAPCGSGAVPHDIREPNRMEAVPVIYGSPGSPDGPDLVSDEPGFAPYEPAYVGARLVRGPEFFPRHHGPRGSGRSHGPAHH
jgi:hypothetical protein